MNQHIAIIRETAQGVEFALKEKGHSPYRQAHYPSLEAALNENPGYDWRLPDSNPGEETAVLRVAHFLD